MRRILAATLLCLFSFQVSCVPALASTALPVHATSLRMQLAALFEPMVSAIANSEIAAIMLGNGDRYSLMHAPAPTLPPSAVALREKRELPVMGQSVAPTERAGVIGLAHLNTDGILHEAPDTHAMGSKSASPRGFAPAMLPLPTPTPATRSVTVNVGQTQFVAINTPGVITILSSTCSGIANLTPQGDGSGAGVSVYGVSAGSCAAMLSYPTSTGSTAKLNLSVTVNASTPTPIPATPTPTPIPTPTPTPTPVPATPTPLPTPTPQPPLTASTTGVNPWWSYEEGGIPGVGKWMANVFSGNLLVQASDVDVKERGIDLVFQRTYNSQATGTSVYGNHFTATFDTHLSYNSTQNIISVNDLDGARYDFSSNGTGGWVAQAGVHSTLTFDGGCGYYWRKTNGSVYYFWAPYACGGLGAGYWGRLYQIWGHNSHNIITFSYGWANSDASTFQNLTQIVASHTDGHALTLNFKKFGANTELANIVLPDNQTTVTYNYDASGNLLEVDRPAVAPGQAARTFYTSSGTPYSSTILPEVYNYSGTQLSSVCNPRYVLAVRNNGGSATDGTCVAFGYDGANRVTAANAYGVVNFTPDDQTNTPLQGGATGWVLYHQIAFAYNQTNKLLQPATEDSDSDGHSTMWAFDGNGRVITTQEWVNGGFNLATFATWDSANNVTSTTDARNLTTYYAYDPYGNTTAVSKPSATANGPRVITTFSYDQNPNESGTPTNLVSACDPVFNAQQTWAGVGTPPGCPTSGIGVTWYSYDYSDTYEPYGRLTTMHSPMGHTSQIAYGAYGLPSSVTGESIAQLDGTTRQAVQSFTYDVYGNLTAYSKSTGLGTWTSTYDGFNRLTTSTDLDNVTSRTCYNGDGSVSATQSALQNSLDGGVACGAHSTTYTYDADGNEVTETHHFGQTPATNKAAGVTQKWYDGADRLVEVLQPVDSSINPQSTGTLTVPVGTNDPTRYLYDLTQSGFATTGTLAIDGASSIIAHGNMYATQMCIYVIGANSPCGWYTTKGAAYDSLDRPTVKYAYSPGTDSLLGGANGPTIARQTTFTYDSGVDQYGASNEGLLTAQTDPQGITTSFAYDNLGETTGVSYTNDPANTSPKSFTYDIDGRTTSTSNSVTSETYQYDQDGRMILTQESGSGITGAATLQYDYYDDGMRKDVVLRSGPSAIAGQTLLQYAYRSDGLRTWLKSNWSATPFTWAYKNSGRMTTQTDPYTGTMTQYPYSNNVMVAKSATYDANGEMSSMTMPNGGVYANVARDTEGQIASYTAEMPGVSAQPIVTMSYDARGEMSGKTVAPTYPGSSASSTIASATVYGLQKPCAVGTSTPCGVYVGGGGVGVRTGTQAIAAPATIASCTTTTGSPTGTAYINYDNDGRRTSQGTECTSGGSTTVNSYYTRSYDADNHMLSDNCTGYQSGNAQTGSPGDYQYCSPNETTYTWGASGHLATMNVAQSDGFAMTGSFSLHWDGGALLYVTDAAGALIQSNVEGLATWTSATNVLTVRDRDFTGAVVSQHQSAVFDQWVAGPDTIYVRLFGSYAPAAQFPSEGTVKLQSKDTMTNEAAITRFLVPGEVLGMNHADGYDDVNLVFQGVRSSDAYTGQWTTPDVFAGRQSDPMTQRSYMLSGNNAVVYSDPSGYDWVTAGWGAGPKPEADSLGGTGGGFRDVSADWVEGHKGGATPDADTMPSQPRRQTTVAQVVPEIIELLIELAEREGAEAVTKELSEAEIEGAWGGSGPGEHSAEEAFEAHPGLGLSESAFAARPLQMLVGAMQPGARVAAVVGAAGRVYLYDPATRLMAIFGTKNGQYIIVNLYPTSKAAFESQGSALLPSELKELLGSFAHH